MHQPAIRPGERSSTVIQFLSSATRFLGRAFLHLLDACEALLASLPGHHVLGIRSPMVSRAMIRPVRRTRRDIVEDAICLRR